MLSFAPEVLSTQQLLEAVSASRAGVSQRCYILCGPAYEVIGSEPSSQSDAAGQQFRGSELSISQ